MSSGCGHSLTRPVQGEARFPDWLKRKIPAGNQLRKTGALLKTLELNTVCEEARCPNRLECYAKGTATFLVLGSACTRSCGFCSIDFSKAPPPPDPDEPRRVAESVLRLGLRHVVITMVARDDLSDHGASHLVELVRSVRHSCPGTTLELLTSDLAGNLDALDAVIREQPEVFNHNLETVERMTPRVRHRATYRRSLELLRQARGALDGYLKSGLMVGLGEEISEIHAAIDDLAAAGCDIVTIGQYLQSDARKLKVKRFVHPDEFEKLAAYGHLKGIRHMYCGPFVRSSYNAELFVPGGSCG
jgi:lipoyl synthase